MQDTLTNNTNSNTEEQQAIKTAYRAMLAELKQQVIAGGLALRQAKLEHRQAQRDGECSYPPDYARTLQRRLNVAYGLLRGRTIEQIERPDSRPLNMTAVNKIMADAKKKHGVPEAE